VDHHDFPHSLPADERAELMGALEEQLGGPLRWLVDDEGFRLVAAAWPDLHLESPRVQLELGFGAVHGPVLSLGAAISEHGHTERYSLSETARTLGLPERGSRDWIVAGDEGVRRAAERVSAVLELQRPLVAGDPDTWATLRRRISEIGARISLELALERARRDAGDAWRARDLARVVEILAPLEGHLPRHQQGWLEYARRRLAR
jgi:hypothetical protein